MEKQQKRRLLLKSYFANTVVINICYINISLCIYCNSIGPPELCGTCVAVIGTLGAAAGQRTNFSGCTNFSNAVIKSITHINITLCVGGNTSAIYLKLGC